ncbi:MAG: hypothetical protein IT245_03045 [Bacteroidia bacterium]|nr:hypothetical protein [Bacteroidia bacterium]
MRTLIIRLILLILPAVAFIGCEDKCYYYADVDSFEPILQPLSDIKNSFSIEQDYPISKPGNIYSYKNFLLVSEKTVGIHILDNTNPANPIPLKFIQLKGNTNFSIVDDILLADNGPDLLSIDISNLNDIKLVKRLEQINMENVRGEMFIVDYLKQTKRKKMPCGSNSRGLSRRQSNDANVQSSSNSTGKGGSMSKFAVIDNYLYIVNSSELIPIDLSNPSNPVNKLKIGLVSSNIETLFPYKTYLYMGASNGIHIYNTSGSKASPSFVNTLEHFFGCDPVIVENDYAFSTIRGGTACRTNSISALNIYDVKSPSNSIWINSINLEEPYGLGIKDDLLFICQGTKGLHVYNWDINTQSVSFRHSYPDIHAFDVIVNGNTLIVTADNGLFQFDISSKDNIIYLSKLAEFN